MKILVLSVQEESVKRLIAEEIVVQLVAKRDTLLVVLGMMDVVVISERND